MSKQYSSYQISLTKKLFWNEQFYTRISAKHIHNNFAQTGNCAHDILPQNKAYIINQTFSSKIQSIAQIMAINSTHQYQHYSYYASVQSMQSVDFILASTAVETSPNTSRIQLNFTGGSSVLDARISAIFFLQFLGRKLNNTKAADCNILMCNFQTVKKIAQSLRLPLQID